MFLTNVHELVIKMNAVNRPQVNEPHLSLWTQWTKVLTQQVKIKKTTANLQAREFTFVSGHRLQKAEGNVRRTTNHGFKFITTEERQKWNWDHFCHSFSDCSHLLIKLVKSERSSNATHKENTLCETSCCYGYYWLHKIICILKFFPATPPLPKKKKFFSLRHKMVKGWARTLTST